MLSAQQKRLLDCIAQAATRLQMRVFLVGGVVRDLLLGGTIHERDLDFIVEGQAAELAKSVSLELGGTVVVFEKFLTAKIQNLTSLTSIAEVDFATARTESYPRPGSLPVVEATTIENDLRRRDFTMNAIALPIDYVRKSLASSSVVEFDQAADHAIDVCGGVSDLASRLLRIIHNHSFEDDPTRIFRAIRYQARLGARIETGTEKLMQAAIDDGALGTISAQRIKNELQKICLERSWCQALETCERYSILSSASLVPRGKKLFPDLQIIEEPLSALEATERLQFLMRLFFYTWDETERAAWAEGFSIGRKVQTAWLKDEQLVETIPLVSTQALTALAGPQILALWWKRGRDSSEVRELLEKELRRRSS